MWRRRRSRDDRNVLFDAALEFGAHWRRDVRTLARERLPEVDAEQLDLLAAEVEAARAAIAQWIEARWARVGRDWSKSDAEAARAFIRELYPWMDRRNASRAINQGTYYAWHG